MVVTNKPKARAVEYSRLNVRIMARGPLSFVSICLSAPSSQGVVKWCVGAGIIRQNQAGERVQPWFPSGRVRLSSWGVFPILSNFLEWGGWLWLETPVPRGGGARVVHY